MIARRPPPQLPRPSHRWQGLLISGVVLWVAGCGAAGDATSTTPPVDGSRLATTTLPATTLPATTLPPSTVAPSTSAPSTTPPTTAPADTSITLFDFLEAGAIGDWVNVDDTVMGGVSSSTTSWDDGQLVFSGDLSLDNNGGFTSTRGPVDPTLGDRLARAAAIALTATGDGNTYLLQIRTTDDALFVQRFTTVAGEERTYSMPLDAFEPVGRFLDPLPDAAPLDPTTTAQLVIYLLDKQEGPFGLAVRRIAAE